MPDLALLETKQVPQLEHLATKIALVLRQLGFMVQRLPPALFLDGDPWILKLVGQHKREVTPQTTSGASEGRAHPMQTMQNQNHNPVMPLLPARPQKGTPTGNQPVPAGGWHTVVVRLMWST